VVITRALAIGGILLAAALAHADGDADAEAWDLMQRGSVLYQKGDYVAARAALVRARELVPGRVFTIDRWLGLTEARLGHCADAVIALERFLASSPTDEAARDDATAARDGCKQELATRGSLRVETTPAGAEVRFDADDPGAPPLGLSPLLLESAPLGDHLVSVRREGYRPGSRIVSISAGQLNTVQLQLVPLVAPPPIAAAVIVARPVKRPFWRRRWFWPVVAGAAVVVIAVGVGVGVAASKPSFPTITFQ